MRVTDGVYNDILSSDLGREMSLSLLCRGWAGRGRVRGAHSEVGRGGGPHERWRQRGAGDGSGREGARARAGCPSPRRRVLG